MYYAFRLHFVSKPEYLENIYKCHKAAANIHTWNLGTSSVPLRAPCNPKPHRPGNHYSSNSLALNVCSRRLDVSKYCDLEVSTYHNIVLSKSSRITIVCSRSLDVSKQCSSFVQQSLSCKTINRKRIYNKGSEPCFVSLFYLRLMLTLLAKKIWQHIYCLVSRRTISIYCA